MIGCIINLWIQVKISHPKLNSLNTKIELQQDLKGVLF